MPYALREAVEEELHRLEREGVLEKLDTSEWGTPVVCVKKDGSIRLCGDYKVTVNQCMYIDQYPLPRPEDLFNQLSGGSKFSILDCHMRTNRCLPYRTAHSLRTQHSSNRFWVW